MLVSTIALYGTEYKECDVDYIKLNQISWLKYNTMVDGNEIYYIILNDSDLYNKIANDILHINVIGTVLCIKLSKTHILKINPIDIPNLLDNSLVDGFNNINLEGFSLDTTGSYSSTIENFNSQPDNMIDDYSNVEYYDYHSEYDSN
jgi:hypothetical protein